MQSLRVGIWDWNLAARELHWSPQYKRLLGIHDIDYQPRPVDFERRVHLDDRCLVMTALKAHLRKDVPFNVECRLRHEDGRYLWVRLGGTAERNRTGKAVRMVGSVDDISTRKEAERELCEREARLRNMFEHAVDGLITIDSKGVIQSYNPACEKMFGYLVDEIVGRSVGILAPETYCGGYDQYLENYLTAGPPKIIGVGREVEARRKD